MTASCPCRRDDIEARKLGNEWLLHDPRSGAVHILNDSARRVWELCDGTRSLADIETSLATAYVTPDTANVRQDLEQVLQSFSEKALLAS